jgi:hypothetical protein
VELDDGETGLWNVVRGDVQRGDRPEIAQQERLLLVRSRRWHEGDPPVLWKTVHATLLIRWLVAMSILGPWIRQNRVNIHWSGQMPLTRDASKHMIAPISPEVNSSQSAEELLTNDAPLRVCNSRSPTNDALQSL